MEYVDLQDRKIGVSNAADDLLDCLDKDVVDKLREVERMAQELRRDWSALLTARANARAKSPSGLDWVYIDSQD